MSFRLVGGYETLRLNPLHGQMIHGHTTHLDKPVGPLALEALNWVQKTAWRINARVLDVVKQCRDLGLTHGGLPKATDYPLPDKLDEFTFAALDKEERARLSKEREELYNLNNSLKGQRAQVYRRIAIADLLADKPRLYYPHFLDFRGRVYPVPQDLTPQGDSLAKGLLEFADGKALSDRGRYWLKVAFANSMGHDKAPLDERAAWTDSYRAEVVKIANSPVECADLWCGDDVDSPWEALAAAFALADDWAGLPVHFPVRLDATCSGIQHLSALMGDAESGRAVNLMNTGKREDIYTEVMRVAQEVVSLRAANGDAEALEWVGNIKRGTVKRAVMTTPYGVTARGIAEQLVADGFVNHIPSGPARYKAADYLRDIIVEALDARIGAPRLAMAYFQSVSRALAAHDKPMVWTTPADLTVNMAYWGTSEVQVRTLYGKLVYYREDVDTKIDAKKQALASAPNVVHSFDAAHLMRTAVACKHAGIRDLAFVHDSFGAHANDIDVMNRLLREEFVSIYSQPQLQLWLESVKQHSGVEDLPAPPPMGDLDVSDVMASPYFFS